MPYFDTSFLTPLVRQEAMSAQVERFVGSLPAGELAISHWTKVEFSSLLARHVRMRGLTAEAAKTVGSGFDTMVDESFAVLLPEVDDFDLAREYLGHHQTGLRAGDALHLAIGANRRMETIFSLDKTFLKAGNMLGLPVSRGV
jgi:predicted nucleic acid-binding protein